MLEMTGLGELNCSVPENEGAQMCGRIKDMFLLKDRQALR